jgi:cysteine desulfurase
MPIIYLDHVGATQLLPEAFEAMVPYLKEKFGNPQARYDLGQMSRQAVDVARGQVSSLIGAEQKEIIFTASGSESNNLAIKGVVQALARRGRHAGKAGTGGHIITTRIEHHSVVNPIKTLESQGYDVTYLPVDTTGLVSPESVAAAVRPDTVLVSIMHANNEIGTIQPIEAIGRITQERDLIFHTDATATAGIIPLDVSQAGVDLLSFSAQQFYGPKGVGALFVRKGTRIASLIEGGIQEGGKRAGTENVAGIVGMGVAAEIAKREIGPRWKRMRLLRDRMMSGLEERIDRLHMTGHRTERLPNIVSFCIEYVEGEAIVMLLARHGVYAAAGSSCSSPELRASSVILALGIPHQIAQGAVLVSLGKSTTEPEIDRFLEIFPTLVRKLRAMSPVYEEVVKQGPSDKRSR